MNSMHYLNDNILRIGLYHAINLYLVYYLIAKKEKKILLSTLKM